MTVHSKLLKSMKSRVAPWLRVLSDRCDLMFNSLPRLGDAVGADDLPLSFIVKRDSHREKAGNGKRHYPMLGPVVKRIDRASSVHVAELTCPQLTQQARSRIYISRRPRRGLSSDLGT